jgi:RNA polymerase sigma-70 factor (ECF subfamily)
MTGSAMSGHPTSVPVNTSAESAPAREPGSNAVLYAASPASESREPLGPSASHGYVFEDIYEQHFPFVWRSVRRLGVADSAVDDAVQEIFVVVHRRLPDFEQRASIKTWIYGIVLRVVRHHRRTLRRKPAQLGGTACDPDVESVTDSDEQGPHERAAKREAVRVLHAILDEIDDEKREVFVLAELEQMSVPEIAEAIDANLNTVYSRLRAARRDFDVAVQRHRARDEWRSR